MPNDELIERVLALTAGTTPSEKAVLKLAAALIKQLDEENFDIENESDARIKFDCEEYRLIPDRFEMLYGVPRPKHWDTPERLAAEEKYMRAERERLGKDQR